MWEKIVKKIVVVGVVGFGYVGLLLLNVFVDFNFWMIGFDVDVKKVDVFNCGESYIKYIGVELI